MTSRTPTLEQLHSEHSAAIVAALRACVRCTDATREDALQTVWCKLAEPGRLDRLRPDTARAYLITCAIREAWAIEKRRDLGPCDPADWLDRARDDHDPQDAVDLAELIAAMHGLPSRAREGAAALLLGLSLEQQVTATGGTLNRADKGRREARAKLEALR